MDKYGIDFVASTDPTPPVAPLPEPEAPSEVSVLNERLGQMERSYKELASSKDTKINELNEQMQLLNTTLRDQISSRPYVGQEAPTAQPPASDDDFWSNYLAEDTPPQQAAGAPAQTVASQERKMNPKDIRKIAREEYRKETEKAHQGIVDQQVEMAQLTTSFQENYRHLHHVGGQVNELYKMIDQANPKLSATEKFQMAVSRAETMFPAPNAPQAPSFPVGGQAGRVQSQAVPGSRQMVNGFPVREAGSAENALNDYMLSRKAASRSRSSNGRF